MKQLVTEIRQKLVNGELLKKNGTAYSDATVAYYNLILPILCNWIPDFDPKDYDTYTNDIRICRNFMNEVALNLRTKMRENNLETVSEESYIGVLRWVIGKIDELYGIKLDTKGNAWRTKQIQVKMIIPEHEKVVRMIKSFVPQSTLQKKVFRFMVVAAITGARYSDIKNWTAKENIEGNYLVYYPQKTGSKPIYIPLNPLLQSQFNKEGRLLCEINYSSLIRCVKEIFRLNGFDEQIVRVRKIGNTKVVQRYYEWEKMGLHRLRASAITAMLSNGLSETEVKSFSGHSMDSKSFKRYVEFSRSHLDSKFGKFMESF